jgi:hypothetical protein
VCDEKDGFKKIPADWQERLFAILWREGVARPALPSYGNEYLKFMGYVLLAIIFAGVVYFSVEPLFHLSDKAGTFLIFLPLSIIGLWLLGDKLIASIKRIQLRDVVGYIRRSKHPHELAV